MTAKDYLSGNQRAALQRMAKYGLPIHSFVEFGNRHYMIGHTTSILAITAHSLCERSLVSVDRTEGRNIWYDITDKGRAAVAEVGA